MIGIALAILTGLLLAGTLPATMPVTATIFGLALANFVFSTGRRYNQARRDQELIERLRRAGRNR